MSSATDQKQIEKTTSKTKKKSKDFSINKEAKNNSKKIRESHFYKKEEV